MRELIDAIAPDQKRLKTLWKQRRERRIEDVEPAV